MLKPLDRAATHAVDLETAFETDAEPIRICSCVWYTHFGLFMLWLGYIAYSG